MGETPSQSPEPVVLTVCTTCRQTGSDPEAMRPGRILADRLAHHLVPCLGDTGVALENASSDWRRFRY